MHKKEKDTTIGVAAHSLRAVKKQSLLELSRNFTNCPIHIHVAEQNKEVTEILNAWNKRPIEWLVENLELNPKWCLIHCTQMLNQEAKLLAIKIANLDEKTKPVNFGKPKKKQSLWQSP